MILNACFTGDTMRRYHAGGQEHTSDIRVGDQVINLNPETLEIEIDRVIEVQAFPYRGDLLHFRDTGFVDLMVTPNHRFLTTADDGQGAVFRTADEIFDGEDIEIPQVRADITVSQMGRVPVLEAPTEMGTQVNPSPGGGCRLPPPLCHRWTSLTSCPGPGNSMEEFLELASSAEGSATQPCYSTASRARAEQMVVLYSLMGNKSRIEYHEGVFKVVSQNTSSEAHVSRATTSAGSSSKVPFDGPVYASPRRRTTP